MSSTSYPEACQSSAHNADINQTIPKTAAQCPAREMRTEMSRNKDIVRRKSNGELEPQMQIAASLSAPKRFLSLVTIEPLAFFAILALYIEFPSLQDLIYTKICLQVVASHPNLTSITASVPSNLSAIQPLTNNGRIQSQSWNSSQIQQVAPIHYIEARDHILCDRLNKTAVPEYIRQEIIDGDSRFWLKYQVIICLLCAISNPHWGGVSDRIGRLIPLNVPICAAIVTNLISLVFGILISLNSHESFQVEWLYLGAVITGISGGLAMVIVNSFSFISDNTSSESRLKRVTILESVIYVSQCFGYFINKLIMNLGLAPPNKPWLNRHFVAFLTCVGLNALCVLYSVLKLRHQKFHRFLNNFEREQQEASIIGETGMQTGSSSGHASITNQRIGDVPNLGSNPERLRELTSSTPDDLDGPIVRADKAFLSWRTLFTFKYYGETYRAATKVRESRTLILLLLLSGFISAMSLTALMSLFYIYVRSDPFNWTTSQYSWWNSLTSISRGAALIALTICMKFVSNWSVPDPLVAAIGFLSKGIGLIMIGLAQSSTLINWSLLAFVLSEYSMPPLRSLLSKLVVHEELAKIYACLASMQSICFLVGNIAFYIAYTSIRRLEFFRITFITVAACEFSCVILMLIIYSKLRSQVSSLVFQ